MGCNSTKPRPRDAEGRNSPGNQLVSTNGNPSIYYIGEKAILTFETNRPLVIPINGADLYQSPVAWSVKVDGVVPAIRDEDYELKTFTGNVDDHLVGVGNAAVYFRTNYTAKLKDGDLLTISVDIVNTDDSALRETLKSFQETERVISNALASADQPQIDDKITKSVAAVQSILDALPDNTPKTKKVIGQSQKHLEKAKATRGTKDQKAQLQMFLAEWKQLTPSVVSESLPYLRFPVKASGVRRFVLYTTEGYRSKFLATRIPVSEIKAFPLPDELVVDILGDKVRDHFYVVALTFQNNSDQDRLINTGLINAYGRAMVLPVYRDDRQPHFTVPLQVSPQSLEQVYAVVSDSKFDRTREWVFRGLEFGGELATAIATGFKGTPDLIKALGIYTGVGIPGLQKFWPDPVPNHLKNIVSFGMPDLIKAPQHGTIGYKLLFFSKDNLHSMISDPTLFKQKAHWLSRTPYLKKPAQIVVYMSFDTLEVPFENVLVPSEGTIESRLGKVQQEANSLNATLQDVQNTWLSVDPEAGFTANNYLTRAQWTTLRSLCTDWSSNTNLKTFAYSDAKVKEITTNMMKTCKATVELLSSEKVNSLFIRPVQENVNTVKLEANNMVSQIIAGRSPELYIASVQELEKKINEAKRVRDFFLLLGQQCGLLASGKINDLLNAADGASYTNAFTELRNILAPVSAKAGELKIGGSRLSLPPDLNVSDTTITPQAAQPAPSTAPPVQPTTPSQPTPPPQPAPVPQPTPNTNTNS